MPHNYNSISHGNFFMKKFILITLALYLVGCGSGTAENSRDVADYTPDTVPDELRDEFNALLLTEYWTALSAISGIFKIDSAGDESYVIIPTYTGGVEAGYEGVSITAYNFLGDDIDASSDCYLPAKQGDLNWALNTGTANDGIGTKIEYVNKFRSRSGNNEFIANIHGGELVYEVAPGSSRLVKVSFNGLTSTDGNLVDTDNLLILSTDKQVWDMIEIVKALQCKGIPAKNAPQGFAGVYDTSLNVYGSYNENYLHISESGRITPWDYMGDAALGLPSRNCYKRDHFYNNKLIGRSVLFNQTENYLFATAQVNIYELRWYLDERGVVTSVGAPDSSDAVDRVESFHSTNDFIGISAKRADLTIADIEAMECEE